MTTASETRTVDPLPGPLRPLEPGLLLGGRYRLGEVLGRGGFGVVQRARDLRLDQDVALKLIHPGRLEGTSLERLRREVRLARDADSDRLVNVFDLAEAEGHVFLVMELVDGGSLRELLAEQTPLEIDRAVELATELLHALGDLHDHGVLHRDVKPANVLVDTAGRLRLADFGLARSLQPETRLTASDTMLGTAAYLFPERGRELTPAADLYSFGVVFFEMLSGRLPFEAGDPVDLLKAHLQATPPKLRRLRPEVPPWLAAIVERLLEKRPEDRFQSAGEVLAAMERRGRRRGARWQIVAAAVMAAAATFGVSSWRDSLTLESPNDDWKAPPALAVGAEPSTATIDPEQDQSVIVVAEDGSLLGVLPPADAAAVFRFGARRWVAVIRDAEPTGGGPPPYRLTLYNPRLDIARVYDLPLRNAIEVLRSNGFAATYGSQIKVFDVDGDGSDELFISLLHTTNYPSTTSLYEPTRHRFREIFRATGHQRAVAIVDFNGDGDNEVLISGINNRLGYLPYLAALELRPPVDRAGIVDSWSLDSNPSENLLTGPRGSLSFYTLAQIERCRKVDPDCLEIDTEQRTIYWRDRTHNDVIELDFQGLRQNVATTASPTARLRARWRAYRHYRRAVSLEWQENFPAARRAYQDALADSELAGEPDLSHWLKMCAGVAAIVGDSAATGHRELDRLLRQLESETASELAFEAGRKLHRLGRIDAALTRYQFAFSESHVEDNRARWELVQSMLLAHLEKGRVEMASQLLDAYHRREPSNRSHQDVFRAYLDWRTGAPPRRAEQINKNSPDLFRYWDFELGMLSQPPPIHAALDELERLLDNSTETRGALLAHRAELLLELGRADDARQTCAQAREWYATIGWRWIPARLLRLDFERRCSRVIA